MLTSAAGPLPAANYRIPSNTHGQRKEIRRHSKKNLRSVPDASDRNWRPESRRGPSWQRPALAPLQTTVTGTVVAGRAVAFPRKGGPALRRRRDMRRRLKPELSSRVTPRPRPLPSPPQRTATGTAVANRPVAWPFARPVAKAHTPKLWSRVGPWPQPLPDPLQRTVTGTVVAGGAAAKALDKPVTKHCDRNCRRHWHRGLAPYQAGYRDRKTELSSLALPSIRGNPSAPITIRQGRAGQGRAGHGTCTVMTWRGMAHAPS